MTLTGRELRSRIDQTGTLALSLETVEIADPGDDDVIVRIEAAPINPSDLGLLLGPADLTSAKVATGGAPKLSFTVPAARLGGVEGRMDKSLPVGNEGAGTVIATGRNTVSLLGRKVGMIGGALYADYKRIAARDVIPLPPGATAADGASMFVNPLTALGFVETARSEGHTAIVHAPAASNLGQMLLRICLKDGIPLVNIVRSQEQVDLLRGMGAMHVLNSKDEDFLPHLAEAIEETGATIAFDAIGGGSLGVAILRAMETAAVRRMTEYSRYGSDTFKHLCIYGSLDPAPTTLDRNGLGFQWEVSSWLLFPFLRKAGQEIAARLRQRVADELLTTFASTYTRTISLAEVLEPDILRAYNRKATGEKFLVDPTRG